MNSGSANDEDRGGGDCDGIMCYVIPVVGCLITVILLAYFGYAFLRKKRILASDIAEIRQRFNAMKFTPVVPGLEPVCGCSHRGATSLSLVCAASCHRSIVAFTSLYPWCVCSCTFLLVGPVLFDGSSPTKPHTSACSSLRRLPASTPDPARKMAYKTTARILCSSREQLPRRAVCRLQAVALTRMALPLSRRVCWRKGISTGWKMG